MDPDGDCVHEGHQLDEERIDQAMDDQEQKVDEHDMPPFKLPPCLERDDRAKQDGESKVDSSSTSKLTEQVPPASNPSIERSMTSSKPRFITGMCRLRTCHFATDPLWNVDLCCGSLTCCSSNTAHHLSKTMTKQA